MANKYQHMQSSSHGTRVECARCMYFERHRKPDTFVSHGWTIQENGEPLCPVYSGREEQLTAFTKYFSVKEKEDCGKYEPK